MILAFDSNNKNHAIIDLQDSDDEEEELFVVDNPEDVSNHIASGFIPPKVARFSGEVSFTRKAPFRDEQRDTMYKTVR